MKKYKHVLVIGKFMNPHIGHEALIEHAISLGEKVSVVVCATPDDRVSPYRRQSWLRETFGYRADFDIFNYLDEGLEGGEESDRDISAVWAKWVTFRYDGSVDALVGSEDYVTYMAEASEGSFVAEIFDQDRLAYPCSSTGVHNGDTDFYLPVCKRDLLGEPL